MQQFKRVFCATGLADKCTKSSTQPVDEKSFRIRLRDGRYLAYKETGVPKNKSNYKVIVAHGIGDSKEINYPECQELRDEIGIYMVQYDRPGYGESGPNPDRSSKNEATDIEELADQLELGPKFYMIGISAGCYSAWSCLKHIPQRIAGVSLVVPPINFTWPSLPNNLIKNDPKRTMARKLVWLGTNGPDTKNLTKHDVEVLVSRPGHRLVGQERMRRKDFDSFVGDIVVTFGKWDFDPLALSNPFSQDENYVHIWQGYEDTFVPFQIQRYVAKKLPWIRYHEVPDGGHFLLYDKQHWEAILRSLFLGDGPNQLYAPNLDD